MTTEPIARFKDFSGSPDPVMFRIHGDEFECIPEIPLDGLAELVQLAEVRDGGPKVMLNKIYEFFDGVMTPDSAALLRKRGKISTAEEPNTNPIGMRHIQEILPWLMEVYGLRPTQPSDGSLDGSGTDDTNLMAGA